MDKDLEQRLTEDQRKHLDRFYKIQTWMGPMVVDLEKLCRENYVRNLLREKFSVLGTEWFKYRHTIRQAVKVADWLSSTSEIKQIYDLDSSPDSEIRRLNITTGNPIKINVFKRFFEFINHDYNDQIKLREQYLVKRKGITDKYYFKSDFCIYHYYGRFINKLEKILYQRQILSPSLGIVDVEIDYYKIDLILYNKEKYPNFQSFILIKPKDLKDYFRRELEHEEYINSFIKH